MKKLIFLSFFLFLSNYLFSQIQRVPTVGGAIMYPTRNIFENTSNSKDLTTLVRALKIADLAERLQGLGPFTVFAPTNEAFNKLKAGSVETLTKLENKEILSSILLYHILSGKFNASDILAKIKEGNGKASFKTIQGGILTASWQGNKVVLSDIKGGTSTVSLADVNQSNGVIHIVDSILIPN